MKIHNREIGYQDGVTGSVRLHGKMSGLAGSLFRYVRTIPGF